MRRSISSTMGFRVEAKDGEIGHVDAFYFDDERWAIRYLPVNTGPRLLGKQVPVSPVLVKDVEWDNRCISLIVGADDIEKSPDVDSKMPIARRMEAAISKHYGYPMYWGGDDLWGAGMSPRLLAREQTPEEEHRLIGEEDNDDTHLRSSREVSGYRIHAQDGDLGHLEDFLFNDHSWQIEYVVLDTKNWLPGKKVLINPHVISSMSWSESRVYVDLVKDSIEGSPGVDTVTESESEDQAKE